MFKASMLCICLVVIMSEWYHQKRGGEYLLQGLGTARAMARARDS